jgi:ketosteroid isomerase-like protein
MSYAGMPYPQRYAWFLRFDESGIVVQVSFFFDKDTAFFDRRAVH